MEIKHSFCEICSPMPCCGVDCTVEDGMIVKTEGTPGHPGGNGRLCTKGLALRQYVYRKDRLTTPLRRVGEKGEGKFEPISWEEAFEEITEKLNAIKGQYGASSVAFYSGYSKWYRPFLQRLCYSFGSVNYGSESSTCFISTAMSWKTAVGYDSLMPDRKNTGTFLGWSYNPYYSRNAGGVPKKKEKVIIVDPRITPAVQMEADLYLRPVPGTDGALAHAIARELIVNNWVDQDYIDQNVYGYDAYKDYVMQFTPERAQEITGVPSEKIREAAKIIGENKPLCINQSASAYVHHRNGYQNHRAIQALCAIMGSYDVLGGMIPSPDTIAHARAGFATNIEAFEWENYPKDAPLPVGCERYPVWGKLVGECQACMLPRAVLEQDPYPVKAMVAFGMNFRMFNADKEMEKALEALDFFVDVDLFLTDSAKCADIVLPCCSTFEREELKVYPGGFAQYYAPAIDPIGSSRADDEIIFELARRLEVKDDLLKDGRDACYGSIFKDTGMDVEALKAEPDQPHKIGNLKRTPVGGYGFRTPSGKFELWSMVLEKIPGFEPLPVYKDSLNDADPKEYPLQLVAGGRLSNALHSRLHDVPSLRALRPEPMADLSPEDAKKLGISQGDPIRLATTEGSILVKANVTGMILPGTVFMYHGYREADVNSIIPKGHNDPYSGYPGFRSTRCLVEKIEKDTKEIQKETENKSDVSVKERFFESASQGLLAFDSSKCTGCGACAVACMDQNDIDSEKGQKPYRKIFKYEEPVSFAEGKEPIAPWRIQFVSAACFHCEDPKCLNACPMNCFKKDEESGLVLIDSAACVGCGACESACPYDAITFRTLDDGSRKAEKCDGCQKRIQAGLRPACVQNCPMGAPTISF